MKKIVLLFLVILPFMGFSQSKKELVLKNDSLKKEFTAKVDSLKFIISFKDEIIAKYRTQLQLLNKRIDSLNLQIAKSNAPAVQTVKTTAPTALAVSSDRVDRIPPKFNKASGILTTAKGWGFNNESGKWVSFNNVVYRQYDNTTARFHGTTWMSHEEQNFISMQTKRMEYNDNTYYVLLVRKWDGYYSYPTICRDWNMYPIITAYVFTEQEYGKLHDMRGELTLNVAHENTSGSRFTTPSEKDVLASMPLSLKYNSDLNFQIQNLIIKNKHIVRFLLPQQKPLYEGSDSYINIKDKYFEVSKDEFDKLIIR